VTAAQVAAEIVAQNPSLTSAVYGAAGKVRIGVPAESGKVFRITIVSGTSLDQLGLVPGQSVEVAPDLLANPWLTTPVVITDGVTTWVDGVDFDSIIDTGEIVWKPSSLAFPNQPLAGSILQASYSYQMRREVEALVNRVKQSTDIVQLEWA
jgi:hypothetical protein